LEREPILVTSEDQRSLFYQLTASNSPGEPLAEPTADILAVSAAWTLGDLLPLEVPVFRVPRRANDFDWLDTGFAVHLISERLARAFSEAKLTGWHTLEARVEDRGGKRVNSFSMLVVTGRSGPVRDDLGTPHSLVIDGILRPGLTRGLVLDPNSWDGSDLFTPGRPLILATERVARVVRATEARGLVATPLRDVWWLTGFSPVRRLHSPPTG
jgi:hypothetical protein